MLRGRSDLRHDAGVYAGEVVRRRRGSSALSEVVTSLRSLADSAVRQRGDSEEISTALSLPAGRFMRKAILITALLLATASCSDDDTDPSPNPTGATITITATGASPRDVTISAGGRITWINQDSVPHQPSSDPHPLHTDCPGLGV